MNIIQAIENQDLFGPFLGDDHSTWENWLAALACLYGIRVHPRHRDLIQECTGRERRLMPRAGFDAALFLLGRRSGKSRIAALVGAYEAVLAGHESKLAKGEKGVVAVCAPTKRQGRIVRDYLRAIFEPPLLQAEVVKESTWEGFELQTGVRIETMAGDFRTVRGHTLLAAIVDEACFFGVEEESKIRSDIELIRAIKPALATTGGKLVVISTPYARKGWSYRQWRTHYGSDASPILVWNAPSRTMNPTLPQSVVTAALAEDPAAARSEYLGEWRDDVAEFVPRSLIEGLVKEGRKELLPRSGCRYVAFADLSGGRNDDAALAIAHKDGRMVVLDKVERYRPPFNPYRVVQLMADTLAHYHTKRVTGDNYAAEFVAGAFKDLGFHFSKSPKSASALYLELLPRLCSGEIELLDNETLVTQLANLERRTRSGGRDVVDHPSGGHDDLANVVAGVAATAVRPRLTLGALRFSDDDTSILTRRRALQCVIQAQSKSA